MKPRPDAPATTRSANANAVGETSAEILTHGAAPLTNGQLLRWMFRFVKPVVGYVILAAVYLSATVFLEIAVVKYFAHAVDQIKNASADAQALARAGLHPSFRQWLFGNDPAAVALRHPVSVLAMLIAVFMLARYLREVSQNKMSMNMVFYIREAVYDKLQRVGFGFHDALSTGQLINRALTDLQNVRQFVQTAMFTSLEIVLTVFGYTAALYTRSPGVMCLALLPLPVWTFYILRFGKKVQPATKLAMEAGDRNLSIITENISGVHVVKAFATERQEVGKYGGNCDTFFERTRAKIRLFANFTPVIRSIGTAAYLVLFFAVGAMIIHGKLTAGDFLFIAAAMGSLLGKLQQVSAISEQYQSAIVSSRRLYEVLMADPTVPEKANAVDLPPGAGLVKFENVSFGYDPAKPVIKDLNFQIKGGGIVALVGPTGAGKTTLVNLISRFYDPQQGRITIDGIDIRDLKLNSLRTQVGVVFQETYLFSDTVAANIAYGRPGLKGGDIEAAARLAQAHEFITNLSHSYDTMLGERGFGLSGGQRQRLAIARAILFNPRVLVLDDATAAIDPETEDLIRRAMNLVLHGRTTFVIAHRISSVKRADLVVVLEKGEITQTGTHDELMNQDGHYREIAAAQLYGDDSLPPTDPNNPSHMKRVAGAKPQIGIEISDDVGPVDAEERKSA